MATMVRREEAYDPMSVMHRAWRLRWSGADAMTAAMSIARAQQLVVARINPGKPIE